MLEAALRLFFPEAFDKCVISCSEDGFGGGHNWVADRVMAWSYMRPSAKAVGLFDADPDAQVSLKRVAERIAAMNGKQKISVLTLKKNAPLISCYQRGFEVPYAMEELMAESVWEHAKREGWLEDRTHPMRLYKFENQEVTFSQYVLEKLPEPHLHRLALKRIAWNRKERFSKYVVRLDDERRSEVLSAFRPVLEDCLKALELV